MSTPSRQGVVTTCFVSIVIPCFNEERFIGQVLENLVHQYEHKHYEIIVVDGNSTDDTRRVISNFMAQNAGLLIRVIDNPTRSIPAALNLGIREAQGELVLRMDAHSVPSENYVRRCVELLTDEQASVVGMPWHIQPGNNSSVAHAIALAVAHPFGIGDARYRLRQASPQFVDTVPFGAFKKSLWQQLGGFNESLLTNEDYDFHYRVKQIGGRVLLDNMAHSDYFARGSFREIAAQYSRYGRWKAQMVKLHPRSIRMRQLVAPAFVLLLLSAIPVSLLWPAAIWFFTIVIALYALLALVFALGIAHRAQNWKLFPLLPIIFFVIHTTWGTSFLLGLVRPPEESHPVVA
ncbi:MAG TPA: glycosyltransferase family 2 protein [Pyrinomonadaceae bacterium]|nr:glycosyltransferase family 2 protein [Pyrinomonadaceae bacterium]